MEQCISTTDLQLLWNGSKAECFHSSHGVRQEDPLSLYLFVICIEKLAHMIQERMEGGRWGVLYDLDIVIIIILLLYY